MSESKQVAAKLSNVLRLHGFVKAGDAKLVNYYARMKDGGMMSLSFSTYSHCTPRMLVALDDYDALDIVFVKNGSELYTPGFLKEFAITQGALSYFPVTDFEALADICFG